MNAILFTDNSNELTKNELKYFKKAEKIIKDAKKEKKQKESKIKICIIVLSVLAILLLVFSTIFAIINIKSDKITKNISIMGIDVSELTREEATAKLKDVCDTRISTDIVLKHNDESYVLPPEQIDVSYDIDDAVEEAYMIGRSGNIFENNFALISQKFNKQNVDLKLNYSEDLLKTVVPQMNENFADGIKEASYTIEGSTLKITAPKNGYVVKYDDLKTLIVNRLSAIDFSEDTIEIPVETGEANPVDIDKIHTEIYKEPVDATFSKNPYKITASETGLDFKISVDDAKALITGDKDEYSIPLKVTYPKVTTNSIGMEAFPDLIATYSSSYGTSSANRANNIALAASKINGKILMPGETFSYNGTVGRRTLAAGFREAGAYSNGQVTSEVGGGICQVSSTLYNSVLRANLEIVERTNHMFQVGYVPIGTDATVSWGAPDFKFKNNRNYAIRIVATTSGRNVRIAIYGLKQDNDYDVEIQSYRTGTINYRTTYTNDSNLGKGRTKVIQGGSNGATSVTYKILKKNGTGVSKEVVSRDRYSPHNQIIARG